MVGGEELDFRQNELYRGSGAASPKLQATSSKHQRISKLQIPRGTNFGRTNYTSRDNGESRMGK
jgi:hypothetical protein